MSLTKAGGKKVKATMIDRLGSRAAYKQHMALIGTIGGATPLAPGKKKGFDTMTPAELDVLSRKAIEAQRRTRPARS